MCACFATIVHSAFVGLAPPPSVNPVNPVCSSPAATSTSRLRNTCCTLLLLASPPALACQGWHSACSLIAQQHRCATSALQHTSCSTPPRACLHVCLFWRASTQENHDTGPASCCPVWTYACMALLCAAGGTGAGTPWMMPRALAPYTSCVTRSSVVMS